MASKIDMSLDELAQEKSWKRPSQFIKKNKPHFIPFTQRPSVKERLGHHPQQDNSRPTTGTSQGISDLRDILAQKQKSTITDLRVKIAPKETQPVQNKTAQTRIKPAPSIAKQTKGKPTIQAKGKTTQAKAGQFKSGQMKSIGQVKGVPFKAGPNKPIMSSTPSIRGRSRTKASVSPGDDSYVHNGGQLDSKSARKTSPFHHPPSYEDTKKITVTISGLNKPLSEVRTWLSTPPGCSRRIQHCSLNACLLALLQIKRY